jgi:predicted transcriptional regulator
MAPKRRQPFSAVLGPLEADVMQAVWERGVVTVRDVQLALVGPRPVAYTTVMTTMGRLSDKGFLERIEGQPAHRYSALVSRDEYARTAVRSVLDWLVGQFGDPAVAHFLDSADTDPQLIRSLREAIAQMEEAADKGE